MAVSSSITQNVPAGTQQIIFNVPAEFENISYAGGLITYAAEPHTILTQADFIIFYLNYLQFYNTLISNFPSIAAAFQVTLPDSAFRTRAITSSNIFQYIQLTSPSSTLVYTLNFDKVALTVDFTVRPSPVTLTLQEFLTGFQWITTFYKQVILT